MDTRLTLSNSAFIVFLLAIAGALFAGYLSFSKLVLQTCALNEGCNYLLGIPTCVYGFVLFVIILVLAWMRLQARSVETFNHLSMQIFWIGVVSILFSGYYAIKDIFFPSAIGTPAYTLILPSCVYGFFVFVIIFILNWRLVKK
jgi:uncharacterized membrane protein YhaH (DUF805 family)